MINKHIIFKFFKEFINYEKKTNRSVVFSYRWFPNFLNIATADETFQNSGDQDSFRYKLKNSANIYESSGSLFFRITTGTKRKSETSE